MANLQQITRDYLLRARTEGVAEFTSATQRLGAVTDSLATKTEAVTKSQVSSTAALERQQRQLDLNYRSMKQFEAATVGILAVFGTIAVVLEQVAKFNKSLADMGASAKRAGLDVATFQIRQFGAALEGISEKDFASGVEGMAKQLNNAVREENDLSRLLDANNVKFKEANRLLIDTNKLLDIGRDLIFRARNEQDKIKIAEQLGLTKEWVPVLDKSAQAFADIGKEATALGLVIDADTIRKAKEFDDEWRKASVVFSTWMKARIAEVLPFLNELIEMATRLKDLFPTKDTASNIVSNLAQPLPGLDLGNIKIGQDVIDAASKVLGFFGITLEDVSTKAKEAGEVLQQVTKIVVDHGQAVTTTAADWNKLARSMSVMNEDVARSLEIFTKGFSGVGEKDKGGGGKDAWERQIDSIDKHIAAMKADTIAVGQSAGVQEQLRAEFGLLEAAKRAEKGVTDEQIAAYTSLRATMSAQQALVAAGIKLNDEDAASFDRVTEAVKKTREQLEFTRALQAGFEQASSSFITPFLRAMAQGKSAVDALRSGLEGVGNTLQSIGTRQISTQLGNLFSGQAVNTGQIGAGASLALIGTAISGIMNLQQRAEQRREQLQQAQQDGMRAMRDRIDSLRERVFMSSINTQTMEGALAELDFRSARELSPFGADAGGKGGPQGEERVLLEQAIANERAAIIKRFGDQAIAEEKRRAEEIEKLRLDFADREFAATNDPSTLAGALLRFDRAAARERQEVAENFAETLPDLERALAAERLQIQRDFTDDATEDMRRMFEDASNFLEGFRRDIDTFIAHFNAGPQSLLDPTARLLSAQSTFSTQYALAAGGNRDALSGITAVFSDLAEAARGVWGSTATGSNIIQNALTQLGALPDLVTAEELVVNAIEAASSSNDAGLADIIALMDTNNDGVVSEIEKLEFIRQHTSGTKDNTATAITRLETQISSLSAQITRLDTANVNLDAIESLTLLVRQNLQTVTAQSGALDAIVRNTNRQLIPDNVAHESEQVTSGNDGFTPKPTFAMGGVLGAYGVGIMGEHHPQGPFFVRAGAHPLPITPSMPPGFAANSNGPSNRELIAEVRALRAEVAALRGATLAGASHVREGVDENTTVARDTNRRVRREPRAA